MQSLPRRLVIAALSTTLIAGPTLALAEDDAHLVPGQRVRVTVPSLRPAPLIGVLHAIDEQVLLLQEPKGGSQLIPREVITRLEWSHGRKSAARSGALVGAAVLGAYGVLGGANSGPGDGDFVTCGSRVGCAVEAGVSLGAIGALLGMILGALHEEEDWREAPAATGARVVLAPRVNRDGARLALAVQW